MNVKSVQDLADVQMQMLSAITQRDRTTVCAYKDSPEMDKAVQVLTQQVNQFHSVDNTQ